MSSSGRDLPGSKDKVASEHRERSEVSFDVAVHPVYKELVMEISWSLGSNSVSRKWVGSP